MKNIKTIKYKNKTVFFSKTKPSDKLLECAYEFLNRKFSTNDQDIVKYKENKARIRMVYKCETNEGIYFCKKYINTVFAKALQDIFRSQRGLRNLLTYYRLKKLNIKTYDILFSMQDNTSHIFRPSLILTAEHKGQSLLDFFNSNTSEMDKQKIIKNFIVFYVDMLKKGIYHRDPNLSNFIIENDDIKLIDLDDIYFPYVNRLSLLKMNLKRFNYFFLITLLQQDNFDLSLSNYDREQIIKTIIRMFNPKLNIKKIWKYLDKKTILKASEIALLQTKL